MATALLLDVNCQRRGLKLQREQPVKRIFRRLGSERRVGTGSFVRIGISSAETLSHG